MSASGNGVSGSGEIRLCPWDTEEDADKFVDDFLFYQELCAKQYRLEEENKRQQRLKPDLNSGKLKPFRTRQQTGSLPSPSTSGEGRVILRARAGGNATSTPSTPTTSARAEKHGGSGTPEDELPLPSVCENDGRETPDSTTESISTSEVVTPQRVRVHAKKKLGFLVKTHKNAHMCPKCKKSLLNEKSLKKHLRIIHSKFKYRCTKCPFTSKYKKTGHFLKVHQNPTMVHDPDADKSTPVTPLPIPKTTSKSQPKVQPNLKRKLETDVKKKKGSGGPGRGRPRKPTAAELGISPATGRVKDDEYEVEGIVAARFEITTKGPATRKKSQSMKYRVKWKGWPKEHNSWIAEADMNSPLLIRRFWKKVAENAKMKALSAEMLDQIRKNSIDATIIIKCVPNIKDIKHPCFQAKPERTGWPSLGALFPTLLGPGSESDIIGGK